jgi:ubiquinone/menaquinone biosynthesis C-methylase UbiE
MNRQDYVITAERERIQAEYRRRERDVARDLYAPWQPAEMMHRSGRKRTAAILLQRAGVFPAAGDACLEVGFGSLGWLGDLITWGVRERDLHGIELNPGRAQVAQEALPMADLRVGDATALPWDDQTFKLVIVSTVFTSILDAEVRRFVAKEIERVLAPGGALLWYDFAVNNPKNPNVRKVSRREIRRLFPTLNGEIKSVSLAAPLARLVASNQAVAAVLETVPILRTHLLGVLVSSDPRR